MFVLTTCKTVPLLWRFHFTLKEKQELLKQFVACKENMESIETTLRITREQEGELETNRELLTVKQMREKGFSALLVINSSNFKFCFASQLDLPLNLCRTILNRRFGPSG